MRKLLSFAVWCARSSRPRHYLPVQQGPKRARYRRRVAPQIGEVLGVNRKRLVRDYRAESSLGSFVADAMRERAGADVAIENAGGLRWDIPTGEVTKGHVLDALPFVNYL
jgi:2',3'-cyclic-nucleotide 2'-phosphodiesterase (5'-nucleotidase family)